MKYLNQLFLLLCLLMALTSFQCGKDEEEDNDVINQLDLLTREKGWGVIAQFVDPPVFIRGMEIDNFTKLFEPCEFNTTVRFIFDKEADKGTMVEFYQGDSCDPFAPAYIIAQIRYHLDQEPPGFFAVSEDTGDASFWEILRLDEERLIITTTNGEKTFTDEFGAKY